MRFTLHPPVRQLALAFPALLVTALPAAISADFDKPTLVLPPASLYDTRPAEPTVLAPAPAQVTPAAQTAAAPPVARPPAAQAQAATPATAPDARSHYAYDASNRGIRSGATGECVRMGTASLQVASGACQAQLIAGKAPAAAPVSPTPVAVAPAPKPPPPTAVAVAQPVKQLGAGSAPAPMPVSQPRPEPVYVVPLPPAPPAAKEERALEPVEPRTLSHNETIAAMSETPMMPEPDLDKLSFSAGALFPLGSNKIKPAGQEKLDELVEQLRGMHYDKIVIVGHTDPTGSKTMNEKLSKRRADAVRAYLVSKGVDGKRIQTEGKGGADPLPKTQNCDALPRMDKIACYAPDRRVEVEVVGGKSQGSASAGLSPHPRS